MAVHQTFRRHGGRYGTLRLRAELHAQGPRVGRWGIRQTLTATGLPTQQPCSFVSRTSDSAPALRASSNSLLGQLAPFTSNKV